ncbi:hypothetical protein WG66_011837 [Moniliophthora roreri]|nr:hypothetical protein WG66_011837 [Moniliophthora roreri]
MSGYPTYYGRISRSTYTVISDVLSSTGQQTPGWMAIGFGTSMTNSPMVVLWSNSDGSITLSQRQATERTMPTIVDNPPRVAVVENSLSATSGDKIQYAFTIPSSGNSSPSIIWAFSDANPGSSAKDAKIHIHIDKGTTKMNFVKAADANTTGGGGSHRLGTTSTNTTSSGSNDSSTLFPSSCGILAFSTLVCGLLVLI